MGDGRQLPAALRAARSADCPDSQTSQADESTVATEMAVRDLRILAAATAPSDQDSVFMPLEIGRVRTVLSGLASVLELVVEITGHLEDQLASERKILDLRQAGGERDPSAKAPGHASRRAGVCLRMAMAEALAAADRLRMAAQALAPPDTASEVLRP